MAQVNFAFNQIFDHDPEQARRVEAAIREGALADEAQRPLSCSVFVVGYGRGLLRVELSGEGWFENLPLQPRGIDPNIFRTLTARLIDRRKRERPGES